MVASAGNIRFLSSQGTLAFRALYLLNMNNFQTLLPSQVLFFVVGGGGGGGEEGDCFVLYCFLLCFFPSSCWEARGVMASTSAFLTCHQC